MKSKSFNLKQKTSEGKHNKTFDFTGYYKTAAETNKTVESSTTIGSAHVGKIQESKSNNFKREHTPKKTKNNLEPLDISLIDIEGPSLDASVARGTPFNESKVTSTPQGSHKDQLPKVKSIMKNSFVQSGDDLDQFHYNVSSGKSKKRNKSVSFMLEDSEQIAVKKTKSNDSIESKSSSPKKTHASKEKIKDLKKLKKEISEKENKDNGNVSLDTGIVGKNNQEVKIPEKSSNAKENTITESTLIVQKDASTTSSNQKKFNLNKKRKLKKVKKQNSEETSETGIENNNNEERLENKHKKLKKKKFLAKPTETVETDTDGEPCSKTRKKDDKPDAIVENLENLSIGDNAHTLTNLIDDMTVAEKDKRKKNKRKIKKDKKQTSSASSIKNVDPKKAEEDKEKIKWKKRKWNKDKKGEVDEDTLPTLVIIENLPLSIMCVYKKILSDHFGKHGIIKKIGIAEVYPTEESKPVFTTTINFYSDGAATKALEENNTTIEGSRIRVRQPLPPTQTTLVVRSYGELTEQALSTTFLPAGKIRNIKHLIKGKKTIATAFVEFDGPEALEKALKLGQQSKIGGKKLHVSRFEVRKKKKKTSVVSENEGDSENSND